jgi:hypothetical protein
MKIIVRFSDGVDRIQDMPEKMLMTGEFKTLIEPAKTMYVTVRHSGKFIGGFPVFEEFTSEDLWG